MKITEPTHINDDKYPLTLVADVNLHNFSLNAYMGRGMVVGLDETGKYLYMLYFLTGRSDPSRNRILATDNNGRVFTKLADPSKAPPDASLLLYDAMDDDNADVYVVSNGSQTGDALQGICNHDGTLLEVLSDYSYEPDSPTHTARITGAVTIRKDRVGLQLCLIQKSPFDVSAEGHYHSYPRLHAGFGRCITTYSRDGNPPRTFEGEPYLLPLRGSAEDVLNTYWGLLDQANRVSIAVKAVPLDIDERADKSSTVLIINQYSEATA